MVGHISNARFVHTSNWDIELHQSLVEGSVPPERNMSLISVPIFCYPPKLEAGDQVLFEYCMF
jgi:hypothetical protein